MTTLANELQRKWLPKFYVTKHVAGDLSYEYEVRPNTSAHVSGGEISVGIGVNTPANVNKVIALIKKQGYPRAYDIWRKRTDMTGKDYKKYQFKYLPEKEALLFVAERDSWAYGDYADSLRKKLGMVYVPRWKDSTDKEWRFPSLTRPHAQKVSRLRKLGVRVRL